jgi:GTP-binding protein
MRPRSAEIVASASGPEGFPRAGLPEVALLGRSNAGKSSLLNRMVGRQRLAFASSKPGTTRLLHFYRVERPGRVLLLVDLPGYGWARVSREERDRWRTLIEGYLGKRPALRACVLLQDLRREVGDDELDLAAWLAERGIPVVVALTKADKLAASPRRRRAELLAAAFGLPWARVVATSAKSGEGMAELWKAIDAVLDA